jgi:hypothetical protein
MTRLSPTSRAVRGTALPETALVITLVLMMLYGAVQTALLGYSQMSADGAAFEAAHTTVAKYGAPNAATDATVASYAKNIATTVFDRIKPTDVTSVTNPNCSTLQTTVTKTMPGFPFVPGAPKTFTVTGRDIEAQTAICASQSDLLGFSNVPPLPGNPGCFGLSTALNSTGNSLSNALQDATTKSNQLKEVLGDLDGLLSLIQPLFNTSNGTSPIVGTITNDVQKILGPLLSGLLAPLLNTVTSAILSNNVVTQVLQDVVNEALSGVTPTVSDITGRLVSALSNVLGPILGGVLGALLNPLLQQLATALTNDIFNPLLPTLTKIAGDHSIVSGLIDGSCS